jgi:hypothetical protein
MPQGRGAKGCVHTLCRRQTILANSLKKSSSGKIERKGRKMKNLITFFRGIEAKRQISLEEERKVPLVLTIDFNMAKLTPHKTVQFKYEL